MRHRIVVLSMALTAFVLVWAAFNIYKDRQPFKVEVTNYDQTSGNNQIHFWSNKQIDSADAWIEKDGKRVYTGSYFGTSTEKYIATDHPMGRTMLVFTAFAEEFPQPGKYYLKVRFVSASGDKYEVCMVTTEVRFHEQTRKL